MSNDLLTQLEKLSELKDKGIITDNEFNEKKRLLLNELDNSIKIKKKIENEQNKATYWLPIPSFILSIFAILSTFDIDNWTSDTNVGFAVFIILALVLGIVSVTTQEKGKGLSIAGIVLSILAVLVFIGNN